MVDPQKPEMRQPEHEEFTIHYCPNSHYFLLQNETTSRSPNDFPKLLGELLSIFESQYGSRRTYHLEFTDTANTQLRNTEINALERIVRLQNKVAQARSVLEG